MASSYSSSPSFLDATPVAPSLQKKTRGRQKVEMVLMEKDSNRLVTFSKRRCGLFKKANELCTLCGAEAATIVFSPGRKAYSFGHPSVGKTIQRFILSSRSSILDLNEEAEIEEPQQTACVKDLNIQLNLVNKEIKIVQKTGEEINDIKKVKEQVYWWDQGVEELGFPQLVHMKHALDLLKKDVIYYDKNCVMFQASNVVNHFPVMGINHPMFGCYGGAAFYPCNGFMEMDRVITTTSSEEGSNFNTGIQHQN